MILLIDWLLKNSLATNYSVELSKNYQKQCRDPGSNRGPLDLQSNALPTELSRLKEKRYSLQIINMDYLCLSNHEGVTWKEFFLNISFRKRMMKWNESSTQHWQDWVYIPDHESLEVPWLLTWSKTFKKNLLKGTENSFHEKIQMGLGSPPFFFLFEK